MLLVLIQLSEEEATPITDDLREELFPTVSEPWALYTRVESDIKPGQERRYFAPDPSLFRSCQSRERLVKYTVGWITVRASWMPVLRAALANGSAPPNSTTKNWKALLLSLFVPNKGTTVGSVTATSVQRNLLAKDMGLTELPYIDYECSTIAGGPSGRLPDMITFNQIQVVAWDLHELNWRADFAVLHRKMSPPKDPLRISPLIAAQSVMMASASGWGVFTDDAEESIADFSADYDDDDSEVFNKDRARGILSVYKFMASWVPVAPVAAPAFKPGSVFDRSTHHLLEMQVAEAYCRVFRKVMNRNPICPAQLPYDSDDDQGASEPET